MPADFASELSYWEQQIVQSVYEEATRRRATREGLTEEFPYLIPYLKDIHRAAARRKPQVLDVGSGPLSMLAFWHNTGMFDLIAVDPLANEYVALLARHGRSPNCPLVQGYGEHLDSLFPPDTFDLAWMHNAMDHTQSPAAVLRAMSTVVRPSGHIIIHGWCHEGSTQAWNGLHQHDLYVEHDGLMCQSRNEEPRRIDEGLPLEAAEVFRKKIGLRSWMRIVFQKVS